MFFGLHSLLDSNALDFDHDGFSDAVEHHCGTDPYDSLDHPSLMDWHLQRLDSDGDGFPDTFEHFMGTDPHSALSHPDVVFAHHFPAGSDLNLPGTYDVSATLPYWSAP